MWLSASCKFKGSLKDEKIFDLFLLNIGDLWIDARQKKEYWEKKNSILPMFGISSCDDID